MKNWLTIGQFSKETGLTPRALRIYEELGLLRSHVRGENGYRYFLKDQISRGKKIRELKELGFSLEEIARFLEADANFDRETLVRLVRAQIERVEEETERLNTRRRELEEILASLRDGHKTLTEKQRRLLMESLLNESIRELKARPLKEPKNIESRLKEEVNCLSRNGQQLELLKALEKVLQLTRERNILTGPGRASAPASLLLFAKGYSKVDPTAWGLMTELFFLSHSPYVWLDVEYSKAQEFKEAGAFSELPQGLEIFKCPFLDILKEIETKVGPIDFDVFSDQSDAVLQPFKKGDVSYVFMLDYPKDSALYSPLAPEYARSKWFDTEKFSEILRSAEIDSFSDIVAIATLYSPEEERLQRLEEYLAAKERPYVHECLSPQARAHLAATRGFFIYREDFLRVVQSYTGWPLEVTNELYRFLNGAPNSFNRLSEYEEKVPADVRGLLVKEAKFVFLKSHMVAMSWFIKRSAVLKSLHPQLYIDAIHAWEDRNGYCWSDLGYVHAGNGKRYLSVFD